MAMMRPEQRRAAATTHPGTGQGSAPPAQSSGEAAMAHAPPTPPKPHDFSAENAALRARARAAATAPANTAPAKSAEDTYWDRVKSGEDWANSHFAEGSMGRMTDPRAAQMNDLIARQKAGLKGLNSQENLAMREQGESEINRQMAQSQERYAGIAGSQGVRGGANAQLQNRAAMEAGQQMDAFQRQMILDNVAIKNQAMDRYGSTLTGQQNTEMGMQQFNIGQGNAELYGRTAVPFQIASGIDATQAAADARDLGGQQIRVAQGAAYDARQQAADDERNRNNRPTQQPIVQGGCCFVVTAATELGITTKDFLSSTTEKCPTRPTNVKAYGVWGPMWASLVRKNRLARYITKELLTPTVGFLQGRKTVRGFVGYYGFYAPMTWASKLYLKLR